MQSLKKKKIFFFFFKESVYNIGAIDFQQSHDKMQIDLLVNTLMI